MNQHSESDPEQKLNTSIFCDYNNANSSAAYKQWQQAQWSHYNPNATLPSDQPAPTPMYPTIDPQTLASIVAQVMVQIITQQPLPPPPVINFLNLSLQATASAIH